MAKFVNVVRGLIDYLMYTENLIVNIHLVLLNKGLCCKSLARFSAFYNNKFAGLYPVPT